MQKTRQKSDAVKLFLFLCLLGLSTLVVMFAHRGWFRAHLPSDHIGIQHEIGYGHYFIESSMFDQLALWIFISTPPLAGAITWLYLQYFKVKL